MRRLRLNRHLPDAEVLAGHAHSYGQVLCYLNGRGMMVADAQKYEIAPASVVFVPPHIHHTFWESVGRRPLSLVLDVEWRGASKRGILIGRLSQAEVGAVRRDLSDLMRLEEPGRPECRLIVAAGVLRILDSLMRSLHVLPERQRQVPSFVQQFDRLVRQEGTMEIKALASRLGYQPDYLNRIFREATGQTLREYRDTILIERAKALLKSRALIADAAGAVGFDDQNYFARWFRKHTGLQPRAFRATA